MSSQSSNPDNSSSSNEGLVMAVKRIPLASLRNALESPVDLFISCASFEERCKSVTNHLDRSVVRKAIVAENKKLANHVSANADYLRHLFEGRCIGAEIDLTEPLASADNLAKALVEAELPGGARCIVDITTFTHEVLLILLRLLSLTLSEDAQAWFVYTGASDYSVGSPPDAKWLSKGISEVRTVLGYPGRFLPSRRTHLVVLVGYEHERASELIACLEPSSLSLGYGRPGTATAPKHQEANVLFHHLVKSSAVTCPNVRDFEFSCCDPWDACQAIVSEAKVAGSANVVVAPMNTKISTIGSALATLRNKDIQLCYARALQYNYTGYSQPGDSCYLFQLPELLSQSNPLEVQISDG